MVAKIAQFRAANDDGLEALASEDTEVALIADLLMLPDVIDHINGSLEPEDFFYRNNQKLARFLFDMRSANVLIDVLSFATWVRDHDRQLFTEIGGKDGIEQIAILSFAADPVIVAERADAVRQRSMQRKAVVRLDELKSKAANPANPYTDIVQEVESLSLDLNKAAPNRGVLSGEQLTEQWYEEFTYSSDHDPRYLPMGLTDVDKIMGGGMEFTDFVVLAGRTNMGKTGFILDRARYWQSIGKKVLIFSLEMPKKQLLRRMIAAIAEVEISDLKNPKNLKKYNPNTYEKVLSLKTEVSQLAPTIIDQDTMKGAPLTPESLMSEVTKWASINKVEPGQGVICIDHIQLLGKGLADYDAVRTIPVYVAVMKAIANSLHFPVIGLSQVKPGVDLRDNKRPSIGDLEWSSSISTLADLVIALYNDEYYNPDTPDRGITEVNFIKTRDFGKGSAKVIFDKARMRFLNYAGRY